MSKDIRYLDEFKQKAGKPTVPVSYAETIAATRRFVADDLHKANSRG